MTFLTIVGVMGILWCFRLVLEGKTSKEIPESSRFLRKDFLGFLENVSVNHFAFLNAEDNTSGLLNRGSMADLPLLRTLLVICQKS